MDTLTAFVQSNVRQTTRASSPWPFFGLTFALTWLPWSYFIMSGRNPLDFASPYSLLFLLGGFGPSLAGIGLTYLHERGRGLSQLWHSTTHLGFGATWYSVVLLAYPAIYVLAGLLDSAANGSAIFRPAADVLAQPIVLLVSALIWFVTGALAEEYGWRGYALDRLQASWGAVGGSLGLGLVWALWHLPLWFMAGLPHSQMPYWLHALGILAFTFILTAVYNGTGRSLAAVMLLHWVDTSVSTLSGLSDLGMLYRTGLMVLIAAALAVYWLRRAT